MIKESIELTKVSNYKSIKDLLLHYFKLYCIKSEWSSSSGEITAEEEFINSLKRILKKYNNSEVAKIGFEIDDNDSLLTMFLAISGCIETEKYLRSLIETNKNDEDQISNCAAGLAALDLDDGFDILMKFVLGTHPIQSSVTYFDVYNDLKYVGNTRANQLKEEIIRGKYFPHFKEKKESILKIIKSMNQAS